MTGLSAPLAAKTRSAAATMRARVRARRSMPTRVR
jgi:hypothetical protein